MVEHVTPRVEPAHFPVKRAVGESVIVEADVFADGHERVEAAVLYRAQGERSRHREMMVPIGNDRYAGSFSPEKVGWYSFRVAGWVDHFLTWRDGIQKKAQAGVTTRVDLQIGARMVQATAARVPAKRAADRQRLERIAAELDSASRSLRRGEEIACSAGLLGLMEQYPDRQFETVGETDVLVLVEPERARFSTWYELFPRSVPGKKGRHGTFIDCVSFLPRLAEMGFDVLYLPPIHPIGHTKRKGQNNALTAGRDDPGSPWAIGSQEGGHTAIHTQLGTPEQFRYLVEQARERGIEVALDIAFQCSPDHPWVRDHPEWFVKRPDGTIQYAENPPKRYEDIFPINFESSEWESLWRELKHVFDHWIGEGVRIFRVDNPHTKSFPFWEWAIQVIKREHPEVIFLSEAFTRPRRMYRLAKLGFTQSYTYFTWRTAKAELAAYFSELYNTPVSEFFRPNLWPNTPDILHEYLQEGGRAAFLIRLVLAATLSSNYGMYGPAYELIQHAPREPGSEEYLNSEKYEIRNWELDTEESIAAEIAAVNRARQEAPALQHNHAFRIHATDSDAILAYSKQSPDLTSTVLIVVNLDYRHSHSGWVEFSAAAVGFPDRRPVTMVDLLGGKRYSWDGYWNYVSLDPHSRGAHIFELKLAPTEQD